MPSRFPWSKSSSSQSYSSDPALDIPTNSSRQDQRFYASRQSPLEPSYNPYTERYPSTTSFDSASPPQSANPQPSRTFSPSPDQTVRSQPYDHHTAYPAPISSQKAEPQKKSFRSKILAAASSSKEELESGIFGRKRSIRRKEAPQKAENNRAEQEEHSRPWPLNTQVAQPANGPANFEPFSPDFDPTELDHQEYEDYPPRPPPHQQQTYVNSAPQQQTPLQAQQTPYPYRNPVAERSLGSTPSTRASFDSLSAPSSRRQPDSRPVSRQSYDRQLSSGPAVQSNPQDHHQQQQNYQESLASLMAPPPSHRHRQNQSVDSTKLNTAKNNLYANPIHSSGAELDPQNSQEPSNHPTGPSAAMHRAQQLAPQEGEARSRTPPPSRPANEMSEAELNQLVKEHRELKQKYNNVKRQYFDKKDQVDSLQNTLAHQRLAQSRTHWDDGEYVTRMTRLDGLISQLAFGMRKEWKYIPGWLQPHCNKDALQLGKQEMTAVGRAFVSRWLMDELFDKYFHPGLTSDLSMHLKWIQRNIRDFAPPSQSVEEDEALTAKINNWRLATVDGLHPVLSSQDAALNREALRKVLNQQLVKDICRHMQQDAQTSSLEGGVHMIIELAVAILANLPLESRDLHITYFTPGQPVISDFMKVETGIPPLPDTSSAMERLEGDQASTISSGSTGGHSMEGQKHDFDADSSSNPEESSKKGFLSGLVGGPKRSASPQRNSGATASQSVQQPQQQSGFVRDEKVRMCVFLGVQNRGKTVLVKAPVFKL